MMAGKKDKDKIKNESKSKVLQFRSTHVKPATIKIDDLARRLKVKPHIFAGLKFYCGWADDARVSQAEFEKKLAAFSKAPINTSPLAK
jgi:hypothetical protein